MITNTEDFSPARLRGLYRRAREAGYASPVFGEEDSIAGPYVLWRHDIDLELPAMLATAEIEAEEGIRSTFFLMTRSWFYNVFSREGEDAVHRLRELGHQVGLHCDLGLGRAAEAGADVVRARVGWEFALVDSAYPGAFARVVSFHNPPDAVLRREFDGFYSTYQPKFFGPVKYLSDSNRHWREGAPERWLDPVRTPRLSILLHPVIWAYPGSTMPEGMREYVTARGTRCRDMLLHDEVNA